MSEIEEFFDDCTEPFCNGCGLLWEECECGSRDFEPDPWDELYDPHYENRCDACGQFWAWCRCVLERKEED